MGIDERIKVGNWIYENWDNVGGLSFLPRSDHAYQLAPYEEIDKDKYEEMIKKVDHIDRPSCPRSKQSEQVSNTI
jgi:hypothetical protein